MPGIDKASGGRGSARRVATNQLTNMPEFQKVKTPVKKDEKFFEKLEFVYPDGTIRVIEEGMYNVQEHSMLLLEEHQKWFDAMTGCM